MEGRWKYGFGNEKKRLTMADLREEARTLTEENKRLKAELFDAKKSLEWSGKKLIEKEAECRNLKLMLMKETNGKDVPEDFWQEGDDGSVFYGNQTVDF